MKSQKNIDIIDKQSKQLNQFFTEINTNIIRDKNEELDEKDIIGCDINCKCVSTEEYCDCSRNKSGVSVNYDSLGLLMNWRNPLYECGLNCFCNKTQQSINKCVNRFTQRNTKCVFEVFLDQSKGHSIRAVNDIKFGQFVGEYCGEVIDRTEAFNRFQLNNNNKEEHNYILIFREHFGVDSIFETIIDARFYGNHCRLINHSCDPNLIAIPVRSDSLRPRICLFASKHISRGQELSYDYGSSDSLLSNKLCFCNSSKCRIYMPSDFSK
jgi:histone-lysine N-methyltransferase SETMAR